MSLQTKYKIEDDIDWDALKSQQKYLAFLRRLPVEKLRKHHRKVFHKDHPFYMKLPGWTPRYYYERRLYFYYAANNYHLPDPFRKDFRKQTIEVLRHQLTDKTRGPDMQIVKELSDFRKFTVEGIMALPEHRVDTYLLRLGYLVDVPLDQKRQILFELYNMHPGDIVPRYSLTTGKPIRYKLRKPNLRQLILENPTADYNTLMDKFGRELKNIRQDVFHQARYRLRKAGYNLPKLKSGRRGIIVGGKATPAGRDIENFTYNYRLKREKTMDVSNRSNNRKKKA